MKNLSGKIPQPMRNVTKRKYMRRDINLPIQPLYTCYAAGGKDTWHDIIRSKIILLTNNNPRNRKKIEQ